MPVTAAEVAALFAKVLPAPVMAKLDPAKPLAAQGVDSLALTTLAVAVQNACRIKISVEDGLTLKTLNDVVAYLNRKGATLG